VNAVFEPYKMSDACEVRFSKRFNEWTLEQDLALMAARQVYLDTVFPRVRVNTLYKRKVDKV